MSKMRRQLTRVIDTTDHLMLIIELLRMLREELDKPELNSFRLQILTDNFISLYEENLTILKFATRDLDKLIPKLKPEKNLKTINNKTTKKQL